MTGSEHVAVEVVSCPACGPGPTRVWLDDGRPTRYVKCRGCGTVFSSPRASRQARFAWLDDRFAGEQVGALTDSRRDALAMEAQIVRRIVVSGRLLDVGCSTGAFFGFFPAQAWARYGVELSPSAAELARRDYGATVHTGALQSAGFSVATFDVVTMLDMLYYADDPAGDLREAARILRPGGLAAIEIPGQAFVLWRSRGPISLLVDGRWTRLQTDSSYIYWFGPKGLQRLLENCGLHPVAWHVIPSPHRAGWRGAASGAYFRMARSAARLTPAALTFAPKYLCLARKAPA